MSDDGRTGELCTGADPSAAFLAEHMDVTSGRLRVGEQGAVWQYRNALRDRDGSTGRGAHRKVAILDTGFDMSNPVLAEHAIARTAMPAVSTIHGTLVALLVHEMAPAAELLLYNVERNGRVREDLVGVALALCSADGVDVVNCSFYLDTDVEYADEAQLPWDQTPSEVQRWVAEFASSARPYVSHACTQPCVIREWTRSNPGIPLIAAAGNHRERVHCPANHSAVVGAAFHRIEPGDDDGTLVLQSELPPEEQARFADLQLEVVGDISQTSFAAPLLAGYLAACDAPDAFTALLTAQRASQLAILFHRSGQAKSARPRPSEIDDLIESAYHAAMNLVPATHRHWENLSSGVCGVCAVLLSDLYANYGLLQLERGQPHRAWAMLESGLRTSPGSVTIMSNLGYSLLSRARDLYTRCNDLEPQAIYRSMAERIGELQSNKAQE